MKKKILVVDDDDGIRDAFQVMLESAEYEVYTSPDADYLLKMENNALPDLILLDVLLSGRDGRDICKSLKSTEETKKIPVIMISAHPSAGKTIKEAGADDYLEKPFEMDTLLAKVALYLH